MIESTTTEKITAAMLQVGGGVTAKKLSEITGMRTSTITGWMAKHAQEHCIHSEGISPKLYSLVDPEARIRLQNVMGSRLPSNQLPRRLISERHTAAASRSYSFPRSQSAAFLSMEAAGC